MKVAIDRVTDKAQSDMGFALNLLKTAQITDDYQQIVRQLAGPLYTEVTRLFPGHMALVYLTTDVRRRQVWNACIAAKLSPELPTNLLEDPVANCHAFLTHKSKDLLASAFGEPVPAFAGLLERLGPIACDVEIYLKLHTLAKCGAKLRRELSGVDRLSPGLILRLAMLPAELRKLKFVRGLKQDRDAKLFIALVEDLRKSNIHEKDEMTERLFAAVQRGEGVPEVVRQIYVRLPFGAPVVPDSNWIRFLANGVEMEAASRRFRCCLRDLVPQAVRGSRQFYEWRAETSAIISLQKARGRWCIDEVKLRRNKNPSDDVLATIKEYFAQHGIDDMPVFSETLEHFIATDAFADIPNELEQQEALLDLNYMFGLPERD